ncbi:hypothetical protein [Thiolapillus sp.]|uniref:hypothetical protein n=1 Tax=Thiolapillus sp. TaxID=2017437 RepID=UPI003AF640D1
MTRTAGAPIGCQRPSRFWGLGCPKIFHEAEDTLVSTAASAATTSPRGWPTCCARPRPMRSPAWPSPRPW